MDVNEEIAALGGTWVRIVATSHIAMLEKEINKTLAEEYRSGAELVDIKLAATPPPDGDSRFGSSFGEQIALITLRLKR